MILQSIVLVVAAAALASALPQHYQQQGQYDNGQYKQPHTAILSHKQALGHDGSFKYSFAADNGLQQGESIAPDGSRIGSYSYVDPKGKTISVHYTADKNGFHVHGDHLPKPVQPIHPVAAPAAPAPAYHHHEQPSYGGYGAAQFPTHQFSAPRPAYYQAAATNQHNNNNGDYDDGDYEDRQDPSKPHTFGDGYAFQIGG